MNQNKEPKQDVGQDSQVQKQIKKLSITADDIREVVAVLERRLESALTSPMVTSEPEDDEKMVDELVPLAADLRRLDDQFRQVRNHIIDVSNRIQL